MTTTFEEVPKPTKKERKCMPVDPENRKYPKAPDLSQVDPVLDAMAFYEARDEAIREHYVYLMTTQILQEKLSRCIFFEGVNKEEKCKHLHEAVQRRLPGGSEYKRFDFIKILEESEAKKAAKEKLNE